MDAAALHRMAVDAFSRRVELIGDDQWHVVTPCAEWSVRDLVNHVTGENRWTPPLLAGRTIEEVGNRFDGDLLGDRPKQMWRDAAVAAVEAVQVEGALDRTVFLSFGETPARDYVMQLFADHLVHGWDLAHAIGADEELDPDLVEACATWFDDVEDAYRGAGVIGPPPSVPSTADAQTRLLARFGRSAR